jgi:hypothetical protein
MSTNYTADPSATQAPASPPVAGAAPELVLPADGDPANAASIAQALKVVADYIAFLQSPFGNAAAQAQPILPAQCARLLKRMGFDHRGFVAGNAMQWREDWINVGATTKTTGSGGWFGRWNYSTNALGGNATVQVVKPTGSADVAFWLGLSGATSPGAAVVEMCGGLQATSGGGVDMVMEFLLRFDGINGSSSFAAGIFDGSLVALAPTAAFETINPKGLGLYLPVGGTNLLFYSNVSGTPGTPVDTGIAAAINTTYRVRLEMQSPNASDNTASRLLCYIDGAVVADVAPGSLPNIAPTPAFYAYDNGTPEQMKIGAVRGSYALQPGNIFT